MLRQSPEPTTVELYRSSLNAPTHIFCLARFSWSLLNPRAAARSSMIFTGTGPFARTSSRNAYGAALLAFVFCRRGGGECLVSGYVHGLLPLNFGC